MADNPFRPVELTDEMRTKFGAVSTATLAGQMQRRGSRNSFLNRLKPLNPGQRLLGYAHTLRYVPKNEEFEKRSTGPNAQRRAVESIEPDDVLIAEAGFEPDAGTIGDIFTMVVKQRGGAGFITDGALRDTPAIAEIGLAVYHQSSHAATLGRLHTPLDNQIPISCAGVTVFPGDILVGDGEGVCVIPARWAEEIANDAYAQELEEEWAIERVTAGESSIGTFPIATERRAEFEEWLAKRG
ncbi:MAG: 5-oxopent-3-ene-1,2,5-tricarboxylate decarboxylase [Acidimicrobiales bacterium]|jgi:5-oxopent-3-ene-1,2,5-tricarboxylate decarboxylase / 2-hydroxyhepta-2,4-diene-1,7-dioate isomerase